MPAHVYNCAESSKALLYQSKLILSAIFENAIDCSALCTNTIFQKSHLVVMYIADVTTVSCVTILQSVTSGRLNFSYKIFKNKCEGKQNVLMRFNKPLLCNQHFIFRKRSVFFTDGNWSRALTFVAYSQRFPNSLSEVRLLLFVT